MGTPLADALFILKKFLLETTVTEDQFIDTTDNHRAAAVIKTATSAVLIERINTVEAVTTIVLATTTTVDIIITDTTHVATTMVEPDFE